jgi:hypothetical protein
MTTARGDERHRRGRDEKTNQPDLLDYPRTPGWRRPRTSIEAAASMAPGLGRLQTAVLAAIAAAGDTGLTADEAALGLRLTPFTARPRCTELCALGLIADTGLRRVNLSGRKAIAWAAVAPDQLPAALAAAERQSRLMHQPSEAERRVRRIMKEDK